MALELTRSLQSSSANHKRKIQSSLADPNRFVYARLVSDQPEGIQVDEIMLFLYAIIGSAAIIQTTINVLDYVESRRAKNER